MRKYKFSKKLISLFLTMITFALTVPIAFAASETLTASNIQSYPTITYKNPDGKMYYGQTVSEAIIINDDEVVLDAIGNQVAGHFEFKDPNKRTSPISSTKADLIFVPDDTNAYTGFTKNRSSITYSVQMTDLVLADASKPPMVAVLVKQGTKLSEIEIDDGKVKNPYYENEEYAEKAYWVWTNPDQVVSESGEYDAYVDATNLSKYYNSFTAKIKVEIEKKLITPVISENPVVNEITYAPNLTWADAVISGGKVLATNEDGTTSEVEGSFAVSKTWETTQVDVSHTEIDVVFTPKNTDLIASVEVKIPVKVNPAPLAFVDAEGNTIPNGEFVFEVEPNERLRNVATRIGPFLKVPEGSLVSIQDANGQMDKGNAKNGEKYTLTVIHNYSNYEKSLTFTAQFKETKLENVRLAPVGPNKWRIDCGDYSPECQFIVYYELNNGEKKELARVNANNEFALNPKVSGNYKITVVYNKSESDFFVIDDIVLTNNVALSWACSSTGGQGGKVKFGDTVVREAPETDPAKADKPYYGFVKWNDVNGNTGLDEEALSNREVSFTMPDGDVQLEATYEFDFIMFLRYIFTTIINWFESVFASLGTLF